MHRRFLVLSLFSAALGCGEDPAGGETGAASESEPSATSTGSTAADTPTTTLPAESTSTGVSGGTGDGSTSPSTGTSEAQTTAELVPDIGGPALPGRCGDAPPEGAVLAPEIPAYGGSCPVLETGYMDGQAANVLPQKVGLLNFDRTFLVIVPEDLQPDERLPVMFMWHWLGGSGEDFYQRADVQNAVNQKRFIAVIPDGRDAEDGVLFKWPFSVLDPQDSLEAEFQLFDDMLSCVAEQFAVDKDCVSSVGVSAGALFTSQLAGGRGDRLASFMSLSGGTGGATVKPWTAPEHKMPGLVLWGGEGDFCIAVDFQQTSQDLEEHLVEDGHFVVECIHNCNHSTPPFEVPEGMTSFAPLWDFFLDHPYWLAPGESPYNDTGLPESMPTWCAVGVGNATPPAEACDKNECS